MGTDIKEILVKNFDTALKQSSYLKVHITHISSILRDMSVLTLEVTWPLYMTLI